MLALELVYLEDRLDVFVKLTNETVGAFVVRRLKPDTAIEPSEVTQWPIGSCASAPSCALWGFIRVGGDIPAPIPTRTSTFST